MLSRPRFLSVCSGIEAASVAFQPLGWEAVAFAEIEAFPSALLALHYPTVPNLGDLRRFREWDESLLAAADVLCGGTPCQAFSVAGLRGSLDDERGNLTLTFCHLYDHLDQIRHLHGRPPAVCLWENVPGILSDKQNAFGCFLAGLAGEDEPLRPPGARWTDAGYVRGPTRAVAWRVLAAQYCGLAQRRERVFVVASADPAVDPAAVLFEFAGLRRDTPPRRGAGEATAPTLSARAQGGGGLGTDADCDGACIAEGGESQAVPQLANCLTRRMHKGLNTTLDEGQTPIVEVTHSLRGEGFDASEDGTGRGTPIIPERGRLGNVETGGYDLLPFDTTQITSKANRSQPKAGGPCHPLAAGAHPPAIAFSAYDAQAFNIHSQNSCAMKGAGPSKAALETEVARAVDTTGFTPNQGGTVVQSAWKVRRLTPEECEVLQGFPIGYTLLPQRQGRLRKGSDLAETCAYIEALGFDPAVAATLAHSPDGPRYKALGNSWAVPVARWIGQRIDAALREQQSTTVNNVQPRQLPSQS